MSVPTHNSEELMNELFKRNQHNHIIIANYHRKAQKKYTRFISLQQLKPKEEESTAEQNQQHNTLKTTARLKYKQSLDSKYTVKREGSTDSRLLYNYASKEKKDQFRQLLRIGRQLKNVYPNSRKSLNKDSQIKLPQSRAPLHLKNIIFQQLNDKLSRQNQYKRSQKKRIIGQSHLPVLFGQKSNNQPEIQCMELS